MRARLAQPAADALDLTDEEALAHERVEVYAVRDDVAARLDRLRRGLGLDQRQVMPERVPVGERARARVVAVALQAATGVGARRLERHHRRLLARRDGDRLDAALRAVARRGARRPQRDVGGREEKAL